MSDDDDTLADRMRSVARVANELRNRELLAELWVKIVQRIERLAGNGEFKLVIRAGEGLYPPVEIRDSVRKLCLDNGFGFDSDFSDEGPGKPTVALVVIDWS
jgi:hypothetical protein